MSGGHGIGLRSVHFGEWLAARPPVGIVEAIGENFAGRGGRPLAVLESIRRDSDVALHCVSLSIGGVDALRVDALRALRVLCERIEAAWISDHLCFGGASGYSAHDLWPLPFTEEAVIHVVERVGRVQDLLGRRLALENIATYVQFADAEMTEWEFLREVVERADAEVLLDLDNVFINAHNHGFDARAFVTAMPSGRLRQIHLAGHDDHGSHLFDAHGGPVPEPVWALYRHCVDVHGPIPCVIEWDRDVPPLARVLAESTRAAEIEAEVLAGRP